MYMSHDEVETTNLSQQDLEHIQFNLGNYFREIKKFTEQHIKDLYFVDDFIKNINLQNIIKVKHKYYDTHIEEIHNVVEIYLDNVVYLNGNNIKNDDFVLYLSDKLFRNKLEFNRHRLNFKGTDYEFDKTITIYLPMFERLGTYLHQMKPIFKYTNLEYWEKRKKKAQYELDTINDMIEQAKKDINDLKEE